MIGLRAAQRPALTARASAKRLAGIHGSGLRAGDALHLGIIPNRGLQLLSLDRVQVKVATTAGISARLL